MVAEGRDLEALKVPLRPSFDAAVAEVAQQSGLARTGERSWVFGTLEESFRQVRAGHEVQGFPALDDEGASVGLRVVASADEQQARHRLGVRRLLALEVPSPAKRLLDGLDNATKLGLAGSPYASVGALVDDCVLAALGRSGRRRPGGARRGGLRRPAAARAPRWSRRVPATCWPGSSTCSPAGVRRSAASVAGSS